MFVSGGSYGGFMTSWLVGHSDRFRAATAMAAVMDQTSMALTTEIPSSLRSTWAARRGTGAPNTSCARHSPTCRR